MMKKEEFLARLEHDLQEISYEERQAALRYYEEYFEEAGNDEEAIKQLDSPEEIARVIKDDLDIKMQLVKSSINSDNQQSNNQKSNADETKTSENSKTQNTAYKTSNNDAVKVILIVVACLIFAPAILGGGFGVIGVLLGISLSAAALIIGGVICVVVGIITCFASPVVGILIVGSGILVTGIGFLFLAFTLWFWGIAVPAFIQWLQKISTKNRNGVAA